MELSQIPWPCDNDGIIIGYSRQHTRNASRVAWGEEAPVSSPFIVFARAPGIITGESVCWMYTRTKARTRTPLQPTTSSCRSNPSPFPAWAQSLQFFCSSFFLTSKREGVIKWRPGVIAHQCLLCCAVVLSSCFYRRQNNRNCWWSAVRLLLGARLETSTS
mgnify:CR=1 FL=1